MEYVICFHGTDEISAAEIRREGFSEGTFFSKHLEDALEFGGPWVFGVCFDEDKLSPGCWKFRISNGKPCGDIVDLTHYAEVAKVFENADLRQTIFESA